MIDVKKLKNNLFIENAVCFDIEEAALTVYSQLGPDLNGYEYKTALCNTLCRMGYDIKEQGSIPLLANDEMIHHAFKSDILVNDLVIVEVKSEKNITEADQERLLARLKLSQKKLGLLVNFNEYRLNNAIRIINHI